MLLRVFVHNPQLFSFLSQRRKETRKYSQGQIYPQRHVWSSASKQYHWKIVVSKCSSFVKVTVQTPETLNLLLEMSEKCSKSSHTRSCIQTFKCFCSNIKIVANYFILSMSRFISKSLQPVYIHECFTEIWYKNTFPSLCELCSSPVAPSVCDLWPSQLL